MIKTKIKVILNKYLRQTITEEDMKCFKIITKHITNKNSTIVIDGGGGFIISNDNSHYYLLFSRNSVLLVNSKSITPLNVSNVVKYRIFKIIELKIRKDRNILKTHILDRKLNILDDILFNLKFI